MAANAGPVTTVIHTADLSPVQAAPAADLMALPFLAPQAITTSSAAYGIAQRDNQLRVAAAAHSWGQRPARTPPSSPAPTCSWTLVWPPRTATGA